ncbi:hypothetical protein HLB25_10295 [Dickeya dadantii]|uniref:hypothetical protein n=1 Tax=Dickeya dadantii TaxID=204038 RepID=UPI0014959E5B|nr:hypothetical protein [Dickeya dadantii]NPE55899.1 hypothetical protein [Dickeya dadantii]NPE67123.1 hypothetical protein [Dickeya dadantii]
MISYADALKELESLVKKANGADKKQLEKAASLIKRSEELQEEAYVLIAKAYQTASHNDLELEDSIHGQFVFMDNFDEIEKEENEKGKNREKELQNISRLDPSGFTETNKDLHDCAGAIVKKAKEIFKSEPVIAQVWSYRWDGYSMISCDLFSQDRTVGMPVTISAVGRQMFKVLDEPDVFDMAEAVHLAGLITKALDAKVIVGLGRNEVNPDVLAKPLGEGHSNGEINLWKEDYTA